MASTECLTMSLCYFLAASWARHIVIAVSRVTLCRRSMQVFDCITVYKPFDDLITDILSCMHMPLSRSCMSW